MPERAYLLGMIRSYQPCQTEELLRDLLVLKRTKTGPEKLPGNGPELDRALKELQEAKLIGWTDEGWVTLKVIEEKQKSLF